MKIHTLKPGKILILAFTASASLTGVAHAMPHPFSAPYSGMLVDAQGDRSIAIDEHTRAMNVTHGETVTFELDDKRFTYTFNAWDPIGAIDLGAIAPKDVKVPAARVCIASNPLYRG